MANQASNQGGKRIPERAGPPGMRARTPALSRAASHPGRGAHARASHRGGCQPSWRRHPSSDKEAIVANQASHQGAKLSCRIFADLHRLPPWGE